MDTDRMDVNSEQVPLMTPEVPSRDKPVGSVDAELSTVKVVGTSPVRPACDGRVAHSMYVGESEVASPTAKVAVLEESP